MKPAICIFEDDAFANLYPVSLTRPVYDLRCGMFTLREKIAGNFPGHSLALCCREMLIERLREADPHVPVNQIDAEAALFINGRVLADNQLAEKLTSNHECVFTCNGEPVAAFLKKASYESLVGRPSGVVDLTRLEKLPAVKVDVKLVSYPWDLVNENAAQITADFEIAGKGGQSFGDVSPHAILLNREAIYIGEGAKIKPGVVLDAERGPIYIGENVTIMPNAVIEGPAYVGEHSIIKIGAKIYEGTSIGPWCKVGGEVEESIIHSYSNKQHEGFLGHAYLGQWVNLGADTNNSDLKNNYGTVKVFINGKWQDSGCQFVGLFMGDHAKSGINTMFNTGTVVGVMSNVYGSGFPPKYVPSFAWGGAEGFVEHDLEKALETARRVMARRNVTMNPGYENLFRHLFDVTRIERKEMAS